MLCAAMLLILCAGVGNLCRLCVNVIMDLGLCWADCFSSKGAVFGGSKSETFNMGCQAFLVTGRLPWGLQAQW